MAGDSADQGQGDAQLIQEVECLKRKLEDERNKLSDEDR